MSNIPPDLQQLWAERDCNQEQVTQSLEQELDINTDDESPLLFIREECDEILLPQQPLPYRSLMQEVTPIPIEKIFPVYSLNPPTIHLGTHHGRPPGNP